MGLNQNISESVGTPVDFTAGVVDVAAQLAPLFGIHLLLTLITLRLEAFIAFTLFRALAVEIILRSIATFSAPIFAASAAIPLSQGKPGGGNACAEQQKMR